MDLFLSPEFIWAVIGILFLLVEFALPGFVLFFFGTGALFTALLCLIFPDLSLNLQLVIFIVSSLLLLIFMRKWLKTVFTGLFNNQTGMPPNSDEYVGETAVVTKPVRGRERGKIEFHGSQWFAVADSSDTEIAEGETVRIVSQDNMTFTVEKINS